MRRGELGLLIAWVVVHVLAALLGERRGPVADASSAGHERPAPAAGTRG